MNYFRLADEQLKELRAEHKIARKRSASSAYKINAVILLGSGWRLKDVQEALILDDDTLRSYVEKYKTGGVDALLETKHAGRASKLDDVQKKSLCEALEATIFLTTKAVIDYVKKVFDIVYSESGMRDLLHRLGYVYKKPKLVPGKPDREAQEIFVEYYEQYMEEKPNDVEVLFVDAVHPEHNSMAAYGWIKR